MPRKPLKPSRQARNLKRQALRLQKALAKLRLRKPHP